MKNGLWLTGLLCAIDDNGFFENRETGEKKHLGYSLGILGTDPYQSAYRAPKTAVLAVNCEKDDELEMQQHIGKIVSLSIRINVRTQKNSGKAVLDMTLVNNGDIEIE